jgi:hypothetical protein
MPAFWLQCAARRVFYGAIKAQNRKLMAQNRKYIAKVMAQNRKIPK